jgi:hypothetical protein
LLLTRLPCRHSSNIVPLCRGKCSDKQRPRLFILLESVIYVKCVSSDLGPKIVHQAHSPQRRGRQILCARRHHIECIEQFCNAQTSLRTEMCLCKSICVAHCLPLRQELSRPARQAGSTRHSNVSQDPFCLASQSPQSRREDCDSMRC